MKHSTKSSNLIRANRRKAKRKAQRRRQRAASEAGHADRPLKIEDSIDSHSHRRLAYSLRRQVELVRAFLYAIHVVSELLAVVNGSHMKPGAERVQAVAIEQRLLHGA